MRLTSFVLASALFAAVFAIPDFMKEGSERQRRKKEKPSKEQQEKLHKEMVAMHDWWCEEGDHVATSRVPMKDTTLCKKWYENQLHIERAIANEEPVKKPVSDTEMPGTANDPFSVVSARHI
jgi:hypothetical protein